MTGRTISHYEILEKLGEGGMGVVYKARDTHLDRFVAVKVLPAEKVANPERKRRFVQEAKAASALNNPHIVTIHDIDQVDGINFIAMEFVPGKTLEQLIPRKGLRLNDALKYSIQIADALAAAHASGIMHRDLKPGNVMVAESGSVKVLDFGLAKLIEGRPIGDSEHTQTMGDRPSTEEGVILGTVSYMSPEQAQGKKVDARSDIFAFGALLYEMLTGRRAFQGDSKMATLAAILNREPEPVVEGIPLELARILHRCLRKEPERRAHSMVDLKLALEELKEETDSGMAQDVAAAPRARRRKLLWAGIAAGLLALAGGTFWLTRKRPAPETPLQTVPLTTYPGTELYPSFSPDGSQVAFSWNGESGENFDIYLKLIGPGRPLRLTTDPAADYAPVWSPDGRSIAFIRRGELGKIEILLIPALGGSERQIAELQTPSDARGLSLAWSPDGRWLVAHGGDSINKSAALFLVSIETGEKRQITFPPAGSRDDRFGVFSPDGRTLAFVRESASYASNLYALSLNANFSGKQEVRQLTSDSRLFYGITWTADSREIVFSFDRGGTPGLWRIAASGTGEPRRLSIGEDALYPSISRQGNRLVYSRSLSDRNIWRVNLSNLREQPLQLISSTRDEFTAQYSPDGKRIAFVSDRSGNREVWLCDMDGRNAVQLTTKGRSGSPRWSPDGQRIVFASTIDGHAQIHTVSARGGQPQRMTSSAANDVLPCWSRDGKSIYFESNRSGTQEIWRMPSGGGEAVQVTRSGGVNPFDSKDGSTIYYIKSNSSLGPLWRVPVAGGEEARVLDPVEFQKFSVTHGGIYFISGPVLQHLSFATGQTKPILTIEKKTSIGLSVSPDEHWLLYTQTDQFGGDLMLVENFR